MTGQLEDPPREECGVFGVWAPGEEVAKLTYYGLYALQHRGQEAANVHLPTDDLAHRFCEQCRRHAFPQLADPPQLNIRTGHL